MQFEAQARLAPELYMENTARVQMSEATKKCAEYVCPILSITKYPLLSCKGRAIAHLFFLFPFLTLLISRAVNFRQNLGMHLVNFEPCFFL